MNINIDVEKLLEWGLSLDEYVYLNNMYLEEKDPNLYKILSYVDEENLQNKGYIKITKDGIVLRTKGIELFENSNLFIKFVNTFPIKAPSGRYLSPLGNKKGVLMTRLKKKWDTHFKNKPHLEEKAIQVLEAELAWRRRNNKLEFINNIEAWLTQANYEKFEYLLNENKTQNEKDMKDLM